MNDYILDLVKRISPDTKEIAFMINRQIRVACCATDDGYKYTVVLMNLGFNATIVSDGICNDPSMTIGQALSDILKNLPCCTGRESEFVPIKYDDMVTLINEIKEGNLKSSRKHTSNHCGVKSNHDTSIIINYDISGKILGYITWVTDEEFGELLETTFYIGKMKVADITELEGLSMEAKLLLSAIAGALIQHLFETNVDLTEAFRTGTFWIGLRK